MKKVEIYDQYADIYADTENNNELITSFERDFNDENVLTRYTLIHLGIGTSTIEASNLTETEANELVETLYNASKTLGISYQDKSINLTGGYASLGINFADGKQLVRVIHTIDE